MKSYLAKALFLSVMVIGLSSCDVNKFLEDMAEAIEQPDQGGDTGRTNPPSTQQPKDDKRTSERAESVESRGEDSSGLETIIVQLDLSPQQLEQYRSINEKYAGDIENVKKSNTDTTTKSKEIKLLRTKQEREIYALLTPAQIEKFNQIKKEGDSDFKGGR